MSSTTIDSHRTSTDSAATKPLPQTGKSVSTREKLALIIPTLREAENIRGILDRTRSALDPFGFPYEILVVDDESSDGTGKIVSAIALDDPRVRLIVRKGEKGVAGATLYGWEHTDASILGVMDADLQHPPEVLPELISAILAGNDLAIGSRYAEGGSLGDWNLARKTISAAALWAALPVQKAGIRAKDPTSGFFMLRRECIDRARLQRSGFKLLLDILVRGRIRSMAEIPFAFGKRSKGESKATFEVACDYASLLAKLYWERFGFGRRTHSSGQAFR